MVVGLEKLFSFLLDHRNWILELLFLESAAICVSDKMYHVVMATEILMYWLMTLTLFDGKTHLMLFSPLEYFNEFFFNLILFDAIQFVLYEFCVQYF